MKEKIGAEKLQMCFLGFSIDFGEAADVNKGHRLFLLKLILCTPSPAALHPRAPASTPSLDPYCSPRVNTSARNYFLFFDGELDCWLNGKIQGRTAYLNQLYPILHLRK